MNRLFLILLFVIITLSANASDCYIKADDDLINFSRCLKLARNGDPDAQVEIGYMYSEGRGVRKDLKKSFMWFYKSANQNEASGQYMVGAMYYYGKGVLQNFTHSHMWFNISSANGYSDATKARNDVSEEMTLNQIEQAQVMASDWMKKHSDKRSN